LVSRGWGGFFNATCTDDELAEELIEELDLRGTDVTNPKDGVILIAESDTPYGRALPMTFAAVSLFRTFRSGSSISPSSVVTHPHGRLEDCFRALKTNPEEWPSNIICRTYLRGVDGMAPGESAEEKKANVDANKDAKSAAEPRPEGASQMDYLPRLADWLTAMENERENDGFKFKAIEPLAFWAAMFMTNCSGWTR
jgi:hypothetical protein